MALRKLIGTVKCFNPRCTAEVPVKEGEGGAVSAACPYCDFAPWAKRGTQAARDIVAIMKPIADPEPAPAPKPAPKPAPAAAPAPSTIFG